jgi:hypothetical protein
MKISSDIFVRARVSGTIDLPADIDVNVRDYGDVYSYMVFFFVSRR